MGLSRRAALGLLLIPWIAILGSCGSDPKGPDPEFTPVEDVEIGPEGGVVDAGVIDLEVPEGALDGVALVSLTDVDPELEDDLIGAFSIENYPVSLEITGAALLDTAYLLLPDFEGDPEFTTLGFKAGGEWQPLEYEQTPEGIRVPVSPEDIDLRDRGYGGDFVQALLHINEDPVLDDWGDYKPEEPVILFVHGILSDSSTWDEEILEFVEDQYGDVCLLTYPWHKLMQLVDDEIIDLLTDRLGDRDIVIVAHSKGGLQSRVIMRQMEDHNLHIRKTLFLATPHYGSLGVRIPIAEVLARALYPDSWQLIAPLIQGLPGVLELLPGSPSLGFLNTPHDFEQPPHYKCVIGNSDGDSDGVVTLTSANIAHSSHEGHRESAILHTGFVTELSHREFSKREAFHHWVGPAHFLEWHGSANNSDFVLVPAGAFEMGAPENELGSLIDEYPQHPVTLTTSFYIQSTEVTNQQFADMLQWAYDNGHVTIDYEGGAVVRTNLDGSNDRVYENWIESPWEINFDNGRFYTDIPEIPVTPMTWKGAAAYCDWLSMSRTPPLPRAYNHQSWSCGGGNPYSASGYRLPTEAEWEYACRAGSITAFANGPITDVIRDPVLDLIGWYKYDEPDSFKFVVVASKIPNSWGIYDMHGNSYEYCNDWYNWRYYEDSPSENPFGPDAEDDWGSGRVLRGGFIEDDAGGCRSAKRWYQSGVHSQPWWTGFRPVLLAQ